MVPVQYGPTLQVLSKAAEEALVKCLEVCSEFNYPLSRRDLQNLVQNYCVEHNVATRKKLDSQKIFCRYFYVRTVRYRYGMVWYGRYRGVLVSILWGNGTVGICM